MSMAKCRGRSMLYDDPPETPPPPSPSITTTAPPLAPQQQQNYLPQTSLLKIEPFVPSFNQRLRRRPIGRSHSTLSHNVIQKRVAQAAAAAAGGANTQPLPQPELLVGHGQLKRSYAAAAHLRSQQRLQRGTVTRQRSKSTSSSAASNSCRPATSAGIGGGTCVTAGSSVVVAAATPTTLVGSTGGTLVSGAIVTPQPNGICRIQRLAKEREELPDRINYDRRGLTAIPIFEQEPNLRLLSLQHNLINTFHIPKELPPPPPPPPPPAPPQIPTVPQATPRENNAASKKKIAASSSGIF